MDKLPENCLSYIFTFLHYSRKQCRSLLLTNKTFHRAFEGRIDLVPGRDDVIIVSLLRNDDKRILRWLHSKESNIYRGFEKDMKNFSVIPLLLFYDRPEITLALLHHPMLCPIEKHMELYALVCFLGFTFAFHEMRKIFHLEGIIKYNDFNFLFAAVMEGRSKITRVLAKESKEDDLKNVLLIDRDIDPKDTKRVKAYSIIIQELNGAES